MNAKRYAGRLCSYLAIVLLTGCASLPDTLAHVNHSLDGMNARLDQIRMERMQEDAPRWGIVDSVHVQQAQYGAHQLTQVLRVRLEGRPDAVIYVTPPPGPLYRPGSVYYF